MSDYNYLNTNAHLEGLLSMRDAEITDLKVVSDHNLATYHQAAELLRAERDKLREQVATFQRHLDDAATSLETIQLRSYGDESYLNTMEQVRGFAASRASVAREALAATEQKP
jgi:hypothetical protein